MTIRQYRRAMWRLRSTWQRWCFELEKALSWRRVRELYNAARSNGDWTAYAHAEMAHIRLYVWRR